MSPSKKQSIQKKLNILKFILLTCFLALIFFLMANVVIYTRNESLNPTQAPDLREKIDLKGEINSIFSKEKNEIGKVSKNNDEKSE